ncbi:MAG: multidrug effflux MFS transporter [bacterium]|nr:multidrug effflux MFS transporter [bacterium]
MVASQKFKLTCRKPNTLSLLLVYAMPNTIIVLFSPCTLSIGKFYNVSTSSLYYLSIIPLIGFAIGPLLSPLISMKYGKKGSLILGNSITLMSILGYIFFTYISASYEMLLLFRFISVFGASIAIISVPAIINEYYHDFYARKMMFLISAIFCLWPGIVMGISGLITAHLGWQYTEFFLLLYSIITYLMMLQLPETQAVLIKEKNILKPYFYNVAKIFNNSQFILFTLIGSIMGVLLYYFISETPFIALHYMGLSSTSYGYFSLIPYIACTAALLLGNIFASKLNFKRAVKIGIFGSLPCAILMLVFFELGYVNIFSVFILSAILLASLSPSFGYGFAKAVASADEKALGTSLFIFIYMIFSSAVPFATKNFTGLLGINVYPITIIIMVIILIILFFIYCSKNKNTQTQD